MLKTLSKELTNMTPYYETLSKMNEWKRQKTSNKADSKLLMSTKMVNFLVTTLGTCDFVVHTRCFVTLLQERPVT